MSVVSYGYLFAKIALHFYLILLHHKYDLISNIELLIVASQFNYQTCP